MSWNKRVENVKRLCLAILCIFVISCLPEEQIPTDRTQQQNKVCIIPVVLTGTDVPEKPDGIYMTSDKPTLLLYDPSRKDSEGYKEAQSLAELRLFLEGKETEFNVVTNPTEHKEEKLYAPVPLWYLRKSDLNSIPVKVEGEFIGNQDKMVGEARISKDNYCIDISDFRDAGAIAVNFKISYNIFQAHDLELWKDFSNFWVDGGEVNLKFFLVQKYYERPMESWRHLIDGPSILGMTSEIPDFMDPRTTVVLPFTPTAGYSSDALIAMYCGDPTVAHAQTSQFFNTVIGEGTPIWIDSIQSLSIFNTRVQEGFGPQSSGSEVYQIQKLIFRKRFLFIPIGEKEPVLFSCEIKSPSSISASSTAWFESTTPLTSVQLVPGEVTNDALIANSAWTSPIFSSIFEITDQEFKKEKVPGSVEIHVNNGYYDYISVAKTTVGPGITAVIAPTKTYYVNQETKEINPEPAVYHLLPIIPSVISSEYKATLEASWNNPQRTGSAVLRSGPTQAVVTPASSFGPNPGDIYNARAFLQDWGKRPEYCGRITARYTAPQQSDPFLLSDFLYNARGETEKGDSAGWPFEILILDPTEYDSQGFVNVLPGNDWDELARANGVSGAWLPGRYVIDLHPQKTNCIVLQQRGLLVAEAPNPAIGVKDSTLGASGCGGDYFIQCVDHKCTGANGACEIGQCCGHPAGGGNCAPCDCVINSNSFKVNPGTYCDI